MTASVTGFDGLALLLFAPPELFFLRSVPRPGDDHKANAVAETTGSKSEHPPFRKGSTHNVYFEFV
jgi:hypothetical protein